MTNLLKDANRPLFRSRAISSAGEQAVYTRQVGGSNPSLPTYSHLACEHCSSKRGIMAVAWYTVPLVEGASLISWLC